MTSPATTDQVYAVVCEVAVLPGPEPGGRPMTRMEWVEGWPRTMQGALTATNRAAWLSVAGGPHEVHLPDGSLMARFERGRRAGLPAGGIIRLADAKAAGDLPTRTGAYPSARRLASVEPGQ
jgi:hypothetical protein